MAHHAAFLRAINVGDRRVTNDRLAAAVEAAGFADVSTFLASGNVVYDAGDTDVATAVELLEASLEAELGFPTEAFVRTAEQLDAILAVEPFESDALSQAVTTPQVAFLRGPLDAATTRAVEALGTNVDHLAVIGSELHWLPMAGVGRAALDWGALGPLVGVTTVRNRNTVQRIRPRLG